MNRGVKKMQFPKDKDSKREKVTIKRGYFTNPTINEPTWRCHQNPFIGALGIWLRERKESDRETKQERYLCNIQKPLTAKEQIFQEAFNLTLDGSVIGLLPRDV